MTRDSAPRTDGAVLGCYRRWLRCYPPSFRREYEDDMLELLIAAHHEHSGQGDDRPARPSRAERLALLRGAAAAWLRPRIAHSHRAATLGVRLMYVTAAAELVVAVVIADTASTLHRAILERDPTYTSTQWRTEMTGTLHPMLERLVLLAGLTATLAWTAGRNGRTARWARVAFAALATLTLGSVALGICHGSATYARTDLTAAAILCLIQLISIATFARAARPARALSAARHR